MATKTRCVAVDDHQVVRQGLEILFGDTEDLELVGTVGSGEDAVSRSCWPQSLDTIDLDRYHRWRRNCRVR